MLVIRRRAGEVLIVGDEIEIEILETSHTQVKLGIRAPQSVSVVRKEIHLTGAQNLSASAQAPEASIHLALHSLRDASSRSKTQVR